MDDLDLGQTVRGFAPGQQVFNRFTLQRILGRGGMGIVWLARDDELERNVALKFLPDIVALDRESVSELKRETRRNLELTHPHIVRIYDFAQDAKAAAISMEYVDGCSLSAAKVDRPGGIFPLAEVTRWTTQLCEALSYAHGRARVVHRDLKPANLMIDSAGVLKITDFGIACSIADSVSRVSKNLGSSGTPLYMSPQQMMGERPSAADDIYAVGATLFELLAGKPPFYTGNIILQVQNKQPVSIAARREELGAATGEPVPALWEETIAACLAKQPAERPPSIAALAERLGLSGTFTPAPPEIVAETPKPPPPVPVTASPPVPARPAAAPAPVVRRKSRAGLWVATAAGVIVLAGAGVWLGDVPNRLEASGRMADAQAAMFAADWPTALRALRETAELRPTDAEYRREFDEAQQRWLEMVGLEIAGLEARAAHDRLQDFAPAAVVLVEPHAGNFQRLTDATTESVREVIRGAIRVAQARTEAREFRAALDALAAVRGHAHLVPEHADADRAVRVARVSDAIDRARDLAGEREFETAFAVLDEVRDDAPVLAEEHAQGVIHVKEAQVGYVLETLRGARQADSSEFSAAFAQLTDMGAHGVLAEQIAETTAEMRRRAEQFSTERLARALVAGDAAEADAAIADYARFTQSQFTVTGAALVGTKDLPGFLAALETLRMRPAADRPRTHGRDIALIAAVRSRFADAPAVTALLRADFDAWSRVEEEAGRPGLALYLLAEAVREGAPADAAREGRLKARLADDVALKIAWAPLRIEGTAGEPLRSEPLRALRTAVEQRVGSFLRPASADGAGIVLLAPTLAGPATADQPRRERKSVRYQSGTRQVRNYAYENLQSQLADAQEDMRQAQRGMQNAEAEAKRQAASTTDPNAALLTALAGGISAGLYQNNYNKAANRAANLRAQLRNTPRTLSEPVYADEPYDVITHNLTYSAELLLTPERSPAASRWRAQVAHQTVEVTGNRDRGVPVQAPSYPAAATLHRQLGQQLAERVRDTSPVMLSLGRSTFAELADRARQAGHDALARADDLWALVLLWRSINVDPDGAARVEQDVRAALGLPRR